MQICFLLTLPVYQINLTSIRWSRAVAALLSVAQYYLVYSLYFYGPEESWFAYHFDFKMEFSLCLSWHRWLSITINNRINKTKTASAIFLTLFMLP